MSYTNFTLDMDADGIALVTWDMPGRSMNVFTEEAMRELNAIVDRVAGDAAIKGAVITSGKDSFSGGADITMLQKMLATFAVEKEKDLEKATKALFDNAGYMTGLFRKIETHGLPQVSILRNRPVM
ncbi:MAG: 3-hydroxyacyl-CoA dehydrogenase, partial [Mesorhizobium sp.]